LIEFCQSGKKKFLSRSFVSYKIWNVCGGIVENLNPICRKLFSKFSGWRIFRKDF
jgi:hypothetical protein